MTRILVVESRAQAAWLRGNLNEFPNTKLIALTAEALQALEEFDLNHEAVSEYADTILVASSSRKLQKNLLILLEEIEAYVLDNYIGSSMSDKGFLTSHMYWLSHAVTILAARAHLMHEIMKSCGPCLVTMFNYSEDDVYMLHTSQPWYPTLPFTSILNQLALLYSFQLDVKSFRPSMFHSFISDSIEAIPFWLQKAVYLMKVFVTNNSTRLTAGLLTNIERQVSSRSNLCVVGGINHEWNTVLSSLDQVDVDILSWKENTSLVGDEFCGWSTIFDTKLSSLGGFSPVKTDIGKYAPNMLEVEALSNIYDKWVAHRKSHADFKIDGIDLADDLIEVINPIVTYGFSLCRYIDDVIEQALDLCSPDLVCFQGVIHMADKRVAHACHMRDIPTIGIQHGGSVGTHINNRIDMNDWGWCQYYMTYGTGIKSVVDPVVPQLAQLISVGSPCLRDAIDVSVIGNSCDHANQMSVLWISDKAFGNTIGHESRGEDTSRYKLQKQCLTILAKHTDINVVFRPFKSTEDSLGTVRWLKGAGLESICVDSNSALNQLLIQSDLVVTDNTASTVWNEVIAHNKPLVLYCDPNQTPLDTEFMSVLEETCCWCKNEADLIKTINRLVSDSGNYISDLRNKDTSVFLEKYVFHKDDSDPVSVASTSLRQIISRGELTISG